jgi:hypothetical protein
MRKGYAHCNHCDVDHPYRVIDEPMRVRTPFGRFRFIGHRAVCDICGADVDVGEVNDANTNQLYAQPNLMRVIDERRKADKARNRKHKAR